MSFWGPSTQQKNDSGQMGAIGNWLFGNAQSDWGNAGQQNSVGNWLQNNATVPGYQDMYNQGFGQDQANAYGDAYAAKMGIPAIKQGMSDITSAQAANNAAANSARTAITAQQADNNDTNFANQQQDNLDTTNREMDRNDATSKGVQDDIWNTYNGARDQSSKFYADQEKNSGAAYDQAQQRLGTQMQFGNATSAQASAPAMAAVQRSLRAQGIDPNSPEGQAQISKVNVGRAQSFDNNMANNIASSNTLTLGKQQANQDLATAGQNNDQALNLKRSDLGNAESLRSTAADNGYDATMHDNTARNLDNNLANQNLQQNNARGDILTNLNNQNSQQTNARNDIMNGYNLDNTAYQQGVAGQTRDNTAKQTALTGLAGQENQAFGNAQGWNAQGTAAANNAFNAYSNDYNNQAKNAGWGTSLIGGLLGGIFG